MVENDIPLDQNEMTLMNIDRTTFDDLKRTHDSLARPTTTPQEQREGKVFVYCEKETFEFKLNVGKDTPTIIGNGDVADINVPYFRWAGEHISVTRIEDLLYFIDRTETNLISFNGIVCKAAVCGIDERMIIRSDDTWVIYDGRPADWRQNIDSDLPMISVSHASRIEEVSTHHPILIGSHPICDLVMSKEFSNPFQGIVYWCHEGINLSMRSRSQGCVMDYPLEDHSAVNINGQQILLSFIGDVYHTVEEFFVPFPPNPELCLLFGEGEAAQTLPIENNTSFTVGSDTSTDITIVDPELDKVQAKIDVRNGALRITNAGIFGSIKINGTETKRGKASLGDKVEIGKYQFYVLLNF